MRRPPVQLCQMMAAVMCLAFGATVCRADLAPIEPAPPSQKEKPAKETPVDFVMSTEYSSNEGYVLIIPEEVLKKSARSSVGATIGDFKMLISGIALALAVFSALVMVRRRGASSSMRKAAVTSLLVAAMLLGALPFAVGDLLPPPPDPVKDKVTVKIVKGSGAVELVRLQRPPRRRGGGQPPDPIEVPNDGAAAPGR